MTRIPILALLAMIASLTGCSTEPVAQKDLHFDMVQADFNVAPKQLADQIKSAIAQPPLGLSVVSQEKGTLTTSYREYQGEFHVVRYWKEQSRFRIEISPDWDNPTGKAKVTVTTQTQQRRTNNQAWEPAAELQRPDRAKEVLDQIVKNVKQ